MPKKIGIKRYRQKASCLIQTSQSFVTLSLFCHMVVKKWKIV